MAKILQPIAGAYPLIKDRWPELRPAIVDPSALQGIAFPQLLVTLNGLQNWIMETERILDHPRVALERRSHIPACKSLLADIDSVRCIKVLGQVIPFGEDGWHVDDTPEVQPSGRSHSW